MKPPHVLHLSIKQLHQKLESRVFAIPKLQREFVWDGNRAASIFDSIYKNMPIGMVLIWEAKRQHFHLLRQKLNILPPFDASHSRGWFLVDGQQRVSVINAAFTGGTQANSSGKDIDFGRICFVLDQKDHDGFAFVYRKPVFRQFAPLKDILSSHWQHKFKEYTQPMTKRLKACREQILNYKVPMVIVESDDLEEVREIFIRINAQGMKIGSADRAFARASRIDLRQLAHELRDGINPSFHDVDFSVILQGFAFVTAEREVDLGQRSLEATIQWWEKQCEIDGPASKFYSRWHTFRTAFQKAVDYLHLNFHVVNTSFLPSTNMIATLAVFFFYHPAQPSAKQRREIRKWFWATGVGQRYSGRGFRTNVIRDVEFFRRLGETGKRTFHFDDLADPLDIARTEYTKRAAITSAFYCLLASRGPTYLNNGQPIPITKDACRANRSDRHHIFPRKMLATFGIRQAQYNSLCNICFIVAEQNQQFGHKRPDKYLEEFRLKKHFSRSMKSHLIPHDGESGLFTKGAVKAFKQFCKARLKHICRAFEEEAGVRLFRKA